MLDAYAGLASLRNWRLRSNSGRLRFAQASNNGVKPCRLSEKITQAKRPDLQIALFRINRHAFSVSFRLHSESRSNSIAICSYTKQRGNSFKICSYQTGTLNLFRMNTCGKTQRVGSLRRQSPQNLRAAKYFRITSLSEGKMQLPSNDILVEKGGGQGRVEVPLEVGFRLQTECVNVTGS